MLTIQSRGYSSNDTEPRVFQYYYILMLLRLPMQRNLRKRNLRQPIKSSQSDLNLAYAYASYAAWGASLIASTRDMTKQQCSVKHYDLPRGKVALSCYLFVALPNPMCRSYICVI